MKRMLPARKGLEEMAAEHGFEPGTLEKVLRLIEILQSVERHPRLREALVLKGGTALNLFGGPPQRLSVDLDFNYIGSEEREMMLEERPHVERAVEDIARQHGYRIQRSTDSHAGRKFFLNYRRFDGISDRVEIDINYLHRVNLLPIERRSVWQPHTDTEAVEAALLSFEEIAAGKLVACLDRAAPRDLWDVARLTELSAQKWPGRLSRPVFVAMSGSLPRPATEYGLSRLAAVREMDVRRELLPMLRSGEQPAADDLIQEAWSTLEPLLDLAEREVEFVERLQLGELHPELLFPENAEMALAVSRHPMLLWKAQNAAGFINE